MSSAMSSSYLLDFSRFVTDSYIRHEAEQVLREAVEAVEIDGYNKQMDLSKSKLDEALACNVRLSREVAALVDEKQALLQERDSVQARALKVRNIFVSDIGCILNEGRSVVKLKARIRSLEDRVATVSQLEADLDDSRQRLAAVEKAYYLTQSARESGDASVCLTTLEDQLLLTVFSFLQTEDVLSAAQVNRLLFARVDNLFSIGSALIQPEWLDGADAVAAVEEASATVGGRLLTQQMADSMTQKLTATEMRIIVSMKDQINKQEKDIHALNTQTEDLTAKVESTESVRDFLIEKLKTAEMAIKSLMKDNSELKVQAAADKEVISFLDLHRLEIDSINRDLLTKNEALRANVDVLSSLNAQMEKQYNMEVHELKDRLTLAEKEHKSHKKLLTKEVKTLRGMLVTSNEELERHRSHLNNLRKSLDVIGLGGSCSAPSPSLNVTAERTNMSAGGRTMYQKNGSDSSTSTNPFA